MRKLYKECVPSSKMFQTRAQFTVPVVEKENINCVVNGNGAVGPHSGVTRCDSDLVSLSDMMSLDETLRPRRKKRQNWLLGGEESSRFPRTDFQLS